ncbi:MAG TPA: lysozyme inhibitor LprI family protein [Pyrinomonadaceae bacterium]|jgi:uncharacterized protein YecT (DUF1311 family)|nr:lysozyme inhibitor LprI family protein [Pyrinomonadaceae bacterium]
MKATTRMTLAALAVACVLSAGGAHAQSQGDMNSAACGKYRRADDELHRVYQQILREYAEDADFVSKLKDAQRAWLAYRDAHVESVFPGEDKRAVYGSVFPMCHCGEMEGLTRERTRVLRRWLTGLPEGDVCAGTIRVSAPKPRPRSKPRR